MKLQVKELIQKKISYLNFSLAGLLMAKELPLKIYSLVRKIVNIILMVNVGTQIIQ